MLGNKNLTLSYNQEVIQQKLFKYLSTFSVLKKRFSKTFHYININSKWYENRYGELRFKHTIQNKLFAIFV